MKNCLKFALATILTLPPISLASEGFVLKAGQGEQLFSGIVIKAAPSAGTQQSIMVEQTFPLGVTTGLHLHERITADSDHPMSQEEILDIENRTGGGRTIN